MHAPDLPECEIRKCHIHFHYSFVINTVRTNLIGIILYDAFFKVHCKLLIHGPLTYAIHCTEII